MEINIQIFDLLFSLEQFINIIVGLLAIISTISGFIWNGIKKIRLPKLLIYVTVKNRTFDFLIVNNSEKLVIINYIEKQEKKQKEKLKDYKPVIRNLICKSELGQIVLHPFSSLNLDTQGFENTQFSKKTKVIVSTNYGKYKAKIIKTD